MLYFYDVPVYRLREERYYRERERYVENALFPPDDPYTTERLEQDKRHPSKNTFARDYLARSYGGAWHYNEVIGYIRLHFLGTQVSDEYIAVSRRRFVKSRTKVFEQQTWSFATETAIPEGADTNVIFATVQKYLNGCRKALPRRYIDTELLERIGPFIDWRKLYLRAQNT